MHTGNASQPSGPLGLLTYEQAAERTGFGQDKLREAASPKTPRARRLHVQRYGHRTVRIFIGDLEDWIRRAGRKETV